MLSALLGHFQNVIQEHSFCYARLHVNGLATQATVRYLPRDDMEIRGLPPDMPPYLSFKDNVVYLDPENKMPVKDEEEAGFYELYRTWDPRVIVRADPKEVPGPSPGRWNAWYDIGKAIRLHPKIAEEIEGFLKQGQKIEFVTDGVRLLELTEWDFLEHSTRLTLVFEYPE
ncbi:MAG: hypothetical protein ACE5IZ_04795 [Dehalococcoidia bacterium]